MKPIGSGQMIRKYIGRKRPKASRRIATRPEVRHPADSCRRRRQRYSHATCIKHRSDLITPAICTGWVKARYGGGAEEEELMQG